MRRWVIHCGATQQEAQLEGETAPLPADFDVTRLEGASRAALLMGDPGSNAPEAVLATFTFCHRAEWLLPGSPVLVRDAGVSRLVAAGLVYE